MVILLKFSISRFVLVDTLEALEAFKALVAKYSTHEFALKISESRGPPAPRARR